MKNRFAKLLSIFLVIALLVGASPVRLAVYAEEDDQATETKTENAEGDKDKGSGEDKTPTPKTAPESQKDKTKADKSTPTPEPDDQKESQAPTTDGDKEGDPDKTPTQEPQTTEKQEPDNDNGEGGETDISETTPAPETHKIPGKAGSTGGNPVHGYTLTLNPNYGGAAVGMYNDVTTMVLPSPKRSDSTFIGWAESSNGEVKYSAGETITLTSDLTLYAIWVFTVTVNNGTGGGSYAEDAIVTVTANTPETGNKFLGWACSDRLRFASGNATTSTATFIMPAYDVTLTAVFTDMMAHYSLSPSEYTLNGSGYTDITCTLTSLKLGYVKKTDTSEYVKAKEIGFYMNAGVLSDGYGHSIPFQVDNQFHFGPENPKYQGNGYDSQGETLIMAIYIDPDVYANAVPGTYTGTFTYDSVWNPGSGEIPGASGSIALTLVIPDKHIVTVNNGTGSGSYAEGANVTITANAPESGKQFKEWAGTDGLKFTSGNATSPTATFTMPGKNVEVMALYKDTEYAEHTIKVNNGSADPAKAAAGTVIKLTADAAPSGEVFDKWTVVSGNVKFANELSSTTTFTMPAENVEVTATYKTVPPRNYIVKVNNGVATPSTSAPGLVVNVKANDAPAGTEFEKWEVVSGTVIFADSTSATTFFVMPAENVEITAKYKSKLSVKGKTATVKYSKVKKKNQTLAVSKVLTFVDKGQGKLTYAKVSGNSKILINKTTGAITVKKKLKKKTYTVKVKVMASGDNSCNPSGWKTVTFKIKVK